MLHSIMSAFDVLRFTSSDTLVETVSIKVQVLNLGSSVVELGSTPLVVPQFFSLSNTINSSVLIIRTQGDLVCTVRLMSGDTNVPMVGRLVQEDNQQRKGTSHNRLP